MTCWRASAGGAGMGLGGISCAESLVNTSAQRGYSRVTESSVVYALRSNCAAGVCPLWHPTQYFATKGLTVCWNCLSSAAVLDAPAAGVAARTSRTGKARNCIAKLIIMIQNCEACGSLAILYHNYDTE